MRGGRREAGAPGFKRPKAGIKQQLTSQLLGKGPFVQSVQPCPQGHEIAGEAEEAAAVEQAKARQSGQKVYGCCEKGRGWLQPAEHSCQSTREQGRHDFADEEWKSGERQIMLWMGQEAMRADQGMFAAARQACCAAAKIAPSPLPAC